MTDTEINAMIDSLVVQLNGRLFGAGVAFAREAGPAGQINSIVVPLLPSVTQQLRSAMDIGFLGSVIDTEGQADPGRFQRIDSGGSSFPVINIFFCGRMAVGTSPGGPMQTQKAITFDASGIRHIYEMADFPIPVGGAQYGYILVADEDGQFGPRVDRGVVRWPSGTPFAGQIDTETMRVLAHEVAHLFARFQSGHPYQWSPPAPLSSNYDSGEHADHRSNTIIEADFSTIPFTVRVNRLPPPRRNILVDRVGLVRVEDFVRCTNCVAEDARFPLFLFPGSLSGMFPPRFEGDYVNFRLISGSAFSSSP